MTDSSTSQNADRGSLLRKLQSYRFLLLVYGLASAVACWEIVFCRQKVDMYLDPQANFTDTLYDLYPQRGEAKIERALQALLCLQSQTLQQPTPAACEQYESKDLRREIRLAFEQGLRTGIKSEEGLYYHYLQILMGSQEPRLKIDAAYRAWKRNFPLSKLPDPRGTPTSSPPVVPK
ncbi:MAG: hypothetical protein ACKVT0_15405 [Planctomycetaceae bacterium]